MARGQHRFRFYFSGVSYCLLGLRPEAIATWRGATSKAFTDAREHERALDEWLAGAEAQSRNPSQEYLAITHMWLATDGCRTRCENWSRLETLDVQLSSRPIQGEYDADRLHHQLPCHFPVLLLRGLASLPGETRGSQQRWRQYVARGLGRKKRKKATSIRDARGGENSCLGGPSHALGMGTASRRVAARRNVAAGKARSTPGEPGSRSGGRCPLCANDCPRR